MIILKEPQVRLVSMTLPVQLMADNIYLDMNDVPNKDNTCEEAWSTDLPIPSNTAARVIEKAARNCYRSESKGEPEKLVALLAANRHDAMLEFVDVTISALCARTTATQMLRHRVSYIGEASSCQENASFAQESTRYCNYSKGKDGGQVTFVDPKFQGPKADVLYQVWEMRCHVSERDYLEAIKDGEKPEDARAFLNPYLATTLFMKTNLRDWLNFSRLRNDGKHAHHNIVDVAGKIHTILQKVCPVLFP